jgi:hypothetical protein
MKHREDKSKKREFSPPSSSPKKNEVARFELPLDLADILAVAVADSVLRAKRRKFRSRSVGRRKQ